MPAALVMVPVLSMLPGEHWSSKSTLSFSSTVPLLSNISTAELQVARLRLVGEDDGSLVHERPGLVDRSTVAASIAIGVVARHA